MSKRFYFSKVFKMFPVYLPLLRYVSILISNHVVLSVTKYDEDFGLNKKWVHTQASFLLLM